MSFQNSDNLKKNEPLQILQFIDSLPSSTKEKMFPDYISYLSSNPNDLFPLYKNGIKNCEIENKENYRGIDFISVKNGSFWNNIGLTYMSLKLFDKAITFYDELYRNGITDSSTITNYAACLLNKLIDKHKIEPEDESKFYFAQKLLYDAFIFDSKAKPKQNLADASLLPAFKNLVLVRNIESELFYNKKQYFTSFILGWISVEMSIYRIMSKVMSDNKIDDIIKDKMMHSDIQEILDALLMLKIIPKELYSEIKGIKDERNQLIHGIALEPTSGRTLNMIELGRKLIPILNS